GARENTQQFQNPATPADGVTLAVNTLRGQQYQGLNLQQIGAKWSNGDPNWAQNVSRATGIGLTDVPNLNDPATLTKLVHGIGVAEGKNLAPFTPDVINQGVQSALAGKSVNFASTAPARGTGSEGSSFTPDQIFTRNQPYVRPGATNYVTQLSPQDEQSFQAWAQKNGVHADPPTDAKSDYDMRGFWKALQAGDPKATTAVDKNDGKIHFPDTWKTPYDLTFSSDSQFANANAPTWNDKDQLVTPDGKIVFDDRNRAPYMGAAQTPSYKPLATYYQENYATIVSNAQTVAEQKWPNDPDLQDRYVTGITKNLNATIKAQDESNKADYGAVQAYVYKNNITTAAQLQG
ncbi:MAG: hypothetical protein KGJ13_13145, partial [Patescibacteria group bacterium]|nr:hypothetical protein [Patescibacteria group bacterium]